MDQLIKPQNLALNETQLSMLLPYLVLALGAMLTLLMAAFKQHKSKIPVASAAVFTTVAALFAICRVSSEPAMTLFNGMMVIDSFSTLFNFLLVGTTGLVLFSSYAYLEKEDLHYGEYYALSLFSCLGMMLLASALDLIVLFVALEVMSIGVYVLVGFRRKDVKSNEAAMKYFILGSAASAVLLFGVSMLYGATGTMNIASISQAVKAGSVAVGNPLFALGALLVVIGFLFKVATVPFHMWMPDVYEGAPTTITNFMTTGLKAAAFAAFVRVFMGFELGHAASEKLAASFHDVLWVVAVLTMFLGNVIALTQQNIKRMLAYSSIAHSGYILVGFIAATKSEAGFFPVVVYLVSYVIMNLGAFAVVAMVGEKGDQNTDVQDLAGIGFRHPLLGFAMAVFMFSMAGVPPTVGFAGKYLIFSAAVQTGEVWLSVLAVLCSAISAYYYLRVIVYMYMKEPVREMQIQFTAPAMVVIALSTAATLVYGLFPGLLIEVAKKAAGAS